MKKILLILFVVSSFFLVGSPLIAQDAKVTSLMSKPVPDIPGKELLMIEVEYPPGSSDPVHRHNAQAFLYVLEGSVVMGVNGGKPVTLTAGGDVPLLVEFECSSDGWHLTMRPPHLDQASTVERGAHV